MSDTEKRDNSALQRLVSITSVLATAGKAGRSAAELAALVGYGGTDESQRESLARDIRKLRAIGLDITNRAEQGAVGHYVLDPRDSRIRLAFTSDQRAELARAALLAGRSGLAAGLGAAEPGAVGGAVLIEPVELPQDLDIVLRAVAAKCLLRFVYNGRDRILDPHSVELHGSEWTVTGFDRSVGEPRAFVVTRMTEVAIDRPGTATGSSGPTAGARPTSDPLTWQIDPPIVAVLDLPARFAADVSRLLGVPVDRATDPGLTVRIEVAVTNRWIFLARVMELGERVRLVGPAELRDELRERLLAHVGGAS